ncbi:uncharacterized protein [Drosophila takahashii]|uniref:uncharacterized protein n=1 Tax=Drosophila takahashii TaxID=29030 RepID=UPI001CF83B2B|nr:uncharacterized protein LOC108066208 [Drosophila takahashii]
MHSHIIAILLATVAIGSCMANPSLISGPSRMMQIMSATSEVQRANPQQTNSCFNYYNAILEADWAAYEDEYAQCGDEFNGGKQEVLEWYDSIVWKVSNSTFETCARLLDCDFKNNSQDALQCYSAEGPESSKNLTAISSDASLSYGSLGQEIQKLDYTRELCCNTSARNYEIRSGNTYTEFQGCLLGVHPVPEVTTTTTTTSRPTTTTTPQPSSSTQSSTAAAPASTAQPTKISQIDSDEHISGNSKHRLAHKLDSIYKHVV